MNRKHGIERRDGGDRTFSFFHKTCMLFALCFIYLTSDITVLLAAIPYNLCQNNVRAGTVANADVTTASYSLSNGKILIIHI